MIIAIYLAWHMIPMIYNPIRRPAPMIRNHILRHTPIGMNIEEVIEIINNNDRWGSPIVNRDSGFIHPDPWGSPWDYNMRIGPLVVGDKSVQTRPEWYNTLLILERHMRIFWGFDENGILIEVYVNSTFNVRLA